MTTHTTSNNDKILESFGRAVMAQQANANVKPAVSASHEPPELVLEIGPRTMSTRDAIGLAIGLANAAKDFSSTGSCLDVQITSLLSRCGDLLAQELG